MTKAELTTIGRAERADFPDLNIENLPVKIDTGADLSSIWAEDVRLVDNRLHVRFFNPESEWYDGKEHVFDEDEYTVTRVANSFGHREIRYRVKVRIRVKGRLIRASFTLSNRSNKLYPVLLGRALLHKKFLVDVSMGDPLAKEERERKEKLRKELETVTEGEV